MVKRGRWERMRPAFGVHSPLDGRMVHVAKKPWKSAITSIAGKDTEAYQREGWWRGGSRLR